MALVLCDCIRDQYGEDIQPRRQCPDCRGRGFVEADHTEAALEAQFEKESKSDDRP